jgi:hypothetical protein
MTALRFSLLPRDRGTAGIPAIFSQADLSRSYSAPQTVVKADGTYAFLEVEVGAV